MWLTPRSLLTRVQSAVDGGRLQRRRRLSFQVLRPLALQTVPRGRGGQRRRPQRHLRQLQWFRPGGRQRQLPVRLPWRTREKGAAQIMWLNVFYSTVKCSCLHHFLCCFFCSSPDVDSVSETDRLCFGERSSSSRYNVHSNFDFFISVSLTPTNKLTIVSNIIYTDWFIYVHNSLSVDLLRVFGQNKTLEAVSFRFSDILIESFFTVFWDFKV